MGAELSLEDIAVYKKTQRCVRGAVVTGWLLGAHGPLDSTWWRGGPAAPLSAKGACEPGLRFRGGPRARPRSLGAIYRPLMMAG